MTNAKVIVALAALASMLAASTGLTPRAAGPDVGGTIGSKAPFSVPAQASIVAVSHGQVLSATGSGLGGVSVIVTSASAAVVDVTDSDRSGAFALVTPADEVLYLTLPGTDVVDVPFIPGDVLTIVLP